MKYNIIGRWGRVRSNTSVLNQVFDAYQTYRTTSSYHHGEVVRYSTYNLSVANKLLKKLSPKDTVDIVRVATPKGLLITLAIQTEECEESAWSAKGSICLEELIEVLEAKGPEYYNPFMSELLVDTEEDV